MRLLVSVRNSEEGAAAMAGGADIIDAKDPANGALGAVSLDVFRSIHATAAGTRPVSAALGDADDETQVQSIARDYADAGASFVKIGFAGVSSCARAATLITAAMRGAGDRSGVMAVAYADADRAGSLGPRSIIEAAARAGAAGVLLDTADKSGPGLRALMARDSLSQWVAAAHGANLLVAVAGQLTIEDMAFVRDAGAEIAGVRGAACVGGRTGQVSAERVRRLLLALRRSIPVPAPDPAAACG
jgi:uncharacterized protein (UPF0264 family)